MSSIGTTRAVFRGSAVAGCAGSGLVLRKEGRKRKLEEQKTPQVLSESQSPKSVLV